MLPLFMLNNLDFLINLKSKLLEHSNIVAYRIVTIPEINSNITDDIKQILKLDHIDQFKTYVRELIDNSSLLEEELSLLKQMQRELYEIRNELKREHEGGVI